MPAKKNTLVKREKMSSRVSRPKEKDEEVIPVKIGKVIDLEDLVTGVALESAVQPEKIDDDALPLKIEEGDVLESEEVSLDDEDTNPFGDKWEI